MGMKSKVRSMQRGALVRPDEAPVTNADLYRTSPPLMTDDEFAHFHFGNRSINDFFLGLSDILKACHHNRLAAAKVAKILNTQNAKTACGQAWTPRLAWFLMKTWRTVYFHKLVQERQARQAAKRSNQPSTSRHIEDSQIGRAVARQQAHTFQTVLRNYFKNPTLGEIFPELEALRHSLLAGLKEQPTVQSNDTAVPVGGVGSTPAPSATQLAPPHTVTFAGDWEGFFRSKEGGIYLAALVRSHPRLLELAPVKDIRFLGCLRAWKAAHPGEKYWTESDAEHVRLAVAEGIQDGHLVKIVR